MTRLWAALIGVGALLTGPSGCSDVESCLEGVEPGCRGSAPDDSGNCKFGLVRSQDGFTCVDGTGSGNQDAGGGKCTCPSGELCRADGDCVDVCEVVTTVPAAKPRPLTCEPVAGEAPYTFERAALALCSQACIHRAAICGTNCDPSSECTQALATNAATLLCPMQDPACAIALCRRARDLPCAMQQCPPGSTANCSGVSCSNNCDMPVFNNDGICDDGDLSNAASYVCDYGTDCGDCGPRRGSAPPFELDVGDPCTDPAQCGGDQYSVKTSTGWCVPADANQDYARCLPDCSNGKSCAKGFQCLGVAQDPDGSGPMPQVQIADLEDGTLVFACFPMQCGN